MWPQSIGDLEVAPPTPSKEHVSGSPNKMKGPYKKKSYYVSKKNTKLSSHDDSLTSVASEKGSGQGACSDHSSGHSALDISVQSVHKTETKDSEDISIRNDFELQADHKVKWRSFDIIEGVVSFETDFENTLNQMECESKQKRQRKAKKRYRKSRLRKKIMYTFLRPKHYKPLVDDPDAIEEIRAIEDEFERRRQEYAPLLEFNNRKFWKKLSSGSDLSGHVQGVAESLAEMTVGSSRTSQPQRLKTTGRRRVMV